MEAAIPLQPDRDAAPESPLSVFESAAVVRLHPGDVVIFRCPGRLSDDTRALVVKMLDEVFPDHESSVLEAGQVIAVLRPEPGILGRCLRTIGRQFTRSDLGGYQPIAQAGQQPLPPPRKP